ncbi:MAG: hypothetical protein SFY56_12680 [Bacteroidota bacterium]|nr:hypothetical protein [Bacteroidota bacterium]
MLDGAIDAVSTLAKSLENKRKRMEATPIVGVYSTFTPKKEQITNCYYLLTEIPSLKGKESCTPLTKSFISAESNQISLMVLAKEMFENTKPIDGIELKALYLAMKKQRESNPESML